MNELLEAAEHLIWLVYGDSDYSNDDLEDAFYTLGVACKKLDPDLSVDFEAEDREGGNSKRLED